jgi:hypothetical protein
MLIDRLKQGIRLIGAAAVTVDDEGAGEGAAGYALSRLQGRGTQRPTSGLADVPAWMNPSLVLATARTTSGM